MSGVLAQWLVNVNQDFATVGDDFLAISIIFAIDEAFLVDKVPDTFTSVPSHKSFGNRALHTGPLMLEPETYLGLGRQMDTIEMDPGHRAALRTGGPLLNWQVYRFIDYCSARAARN